MNRDKNEADGMNLEVDSKERDDAYLNERSVIFKEEMVGGGERVTTVKSAKAITVPYRIV